MHKMLTGQSHNTISKNFNLLYNNVLNLITSTSDCELLYYYMCNWLY
jgi:hypothetical protein